MKHLIAIFIMFLSPSVFAVDESSLTKSWQKTPFGLYLNPQEAYDLKSQNPDSVLLIDVRNQAEIHYTGIPLITDANIPYRFDSVKWKTKKKGPYGSFKKPKNPYFVQAVINLMSSKNLTKETPIIIMCATGARAPFAAKALHKAGFKTVYTQIEGFEGSKAKSGEHKGKRVVNGWKNANLPWSYDLIPEKMYFNFEGV